MAGSHKMFVWTAADLTGLEHELAMPSVPSPDEVKPWQEIVIPKWPPPPIWELVLEGRPIFDPAPEGDPPWRDDDFEPGPPLTLNWLRIQNQTAFDDPFAEAARLLLPIDMSVSNAAYRPHMGKDLWLPTMELTAAFHDLASGSTWMLADCESPVGRGGLMWADAKIWSEEGRLLATGAQLMLQRQMTQP